MTIADEQILTQPVPTCRLCGGQGDVIHTQVADRLFGAPGRWDFRRCVNPACGAIWLDPAPTEADIPKVYAGYYTHQSAVYGLDNSSTFVNRTKRAYLHYRYGYDTLRSGPTLLDLLLFVLTYLRPDRQADADFRAMYLPRVVNGKVLEVGCGNGLGLNFLRMLGWQVEGVDFDEHAVLAAQALDLAVQAGDLTAQSYPADSFDAVTMLHLIEHVYDPRSLLFECQRILKPGGRLVVITPNAASWGHRRFGSAWRGLEPPRHLQVFTRSSLADLAQDAGFQRIKAVATIRGANEYLLASRLIAEAKEYKMGGVHPPALRRWGWIQQLLEWLLLRVEPDAGEELLLTAQK